jgi:hypothetical protein
MAKLISKRYTPKNLVEAIEAIEKIFDSHKTIEPKDIVIDLRKMGFKIVKVDNGEKS